MKNTLWNMLPRWILTWLVCSALWLGLQVFLKTDGRWWIAVPVLLVLCGILSTERFREFWAMLALWITGFAICLIVSDRTLLGEAVQDVFARTGEANAYGELVLLLLCAAAAIPISILIRFYWSRTALSLGWTALWIAAAIFEWPMPRLIPALMIPLLLLTLAETIRRLRRGPEPDDALKRAVFLSLVPAAALLIFLPTPAEPYGYPLLHKIAQTAEQLWHDMGTAVRFRIEGDREFSLSFNGVSDRAETAADSEAEASVIYVKSGKTTDGALYIFGNAWDTFDGRGWRSALKQEDADALNRSLDTVQHVYALWRLLGAQDASSAFLDYYRSNSLFVSCENIDMRTMFSVMNATHINTDTERFPYADTPTGSLFDYVQKDEVWYKVYFLEPNVRKSGALIAASEGRGYNAEARGPKWYRVEQDFGRRFELDLAYNVNLEKAFAERETLIRSVYLDCSDVSEQAAALAREITADCGSDYEKLCAIAAYLQENYGYTTHPDPVPKGENFLDWLLFEKKEGYCAWYATAAVLLARSVGVPARYVQGYRRALDGGVYTRLVPEDAHAWCEGYVSGYGWVTAEATPGFESGGVGWLTAAEALEQYGSYAETEIPAAPEMEQTPEMPEENGEDLPVVPVPGSLNEEEEEPVSEPEPAPSRSGWTTVLLIAVVPAALVSLLLWLRAKRKERYAKAEPAARLQMDLEKLLRDLRGKGYPRLPEESLRQYFERLPDFLIESEDEMKEMTALYDRTFFALTEPSETELEQHRAFAARFRPRTLRQWMTRCGLQ